MSIAVAWRFQIDPPLAFAKSSLSAEFFFSPNNLIQFLKLFSYSLVTVSEDFVEKFLFKSFEFCHMHG